MPGKNNFGVPSGYGAAVLDAYYNVTPDAWSTFYDTKWLSQSFTAGKPRLKKVRVMLCRTDAIAGTVVVSIYASAGGAVDEPSGPVLASATMPATDVVKYSVNNAGLWYDFLFDLALTVGNQYCIVGKCTGTTFPDVIYWRDDQTHVYGIQGACNSTDSGSSWASFAEVLQFETYGALLVTHPPGYVNGYHVP